MNDQTEGVVLTSKRFKATRGYPDEHWQEVARIVATHPERHEWYFRASTVVAEHYAGLSLASARYWVIRARERGWLTGNDLGWAWPADAEEG